MLDCKDLYQQHVVKHANNFIKVMLSPTELSNIVSIATSIVEEKEKETAHKKDGLSSLKRFINGLKGEMAVSKYLKIPIINPSAGVSIDFDSPDIPGFNVGVKTVEYEHFPVIPKENTYPQIICICHPTSNNIVYICGLADVNTLNTYQHSDLILDPNLKAKGTKTGFWGFFQLKEVSKDAIEPYKLPEEMEDSNLESVE